jgi:hypothetical protein
VNLIEDEEIGFVDEPFVFVLCIGVNQAVIYRIWVREQNVDTLLQDIVFCQPQEIKRHIVRRIVLTVCLLWDELEPRRIVSDSDATAAVLTFFEFIVVPWTLEVTESRIQISFGT